MPNTDSWCGCLQRDGGFIGSQSSDSAVKSEMKLLAESWLLIFFLFCYYLFYFFQSADRPRNNLSSYSRWWIRWAAETGSCYSRPPLIGSTFYVVLLLICESWVWEIPPQKRRVVSEMTRVTGELIGRPLKYFDIFLRDYRFLLDCSSPIGSCGYQSITQRKSDLFFFVLCVVQDIKSAYSLY